MFVLLQGTVDISTSVTSTWIQNSWNWIKRYDKDPSKTTEIRNLVYEMPDVTLRSTQFEGYLATIDVTPVR